MRFTLAIFLVVFLTALSNTGRSQTFPGDLPSPASRLRLLSLAERCAAAGVYGAARDALDTVLAPGGGDALRVRALVLRAACNRAMNDRIAADRDYERIITLAPNGIAGVNAARDRGTLAFDHHEFQQARELLAAAILHGRELFFSDDSTKARAAVADAWYWTGKCFMKYDQREEARWAFDSAEAVFPRNAHGDESFYETALLAMRDGDFAGAAILYQKIVDVYPNSQLLLDARLHEAQCFIEERNFSSANDAVNAARELLASAVSSESPRVMHIPSDAQSQLAYLDGEIASGAGDDLKAVEHFVHALTYSHAEVLHRSILFSLGWSAYRGGHNVDAIAWFDSVAMQDMPRDEITDRAEFLAAIAALHAGLDTDGEKRLYAIAGNIDHSRTADANLELALRTFRFSQFDDAKRFNERAIKRGRGTIIEARAEILKGELLLAQEQFADAASALRTANTTLAHLENSGDSVGALRAVAEVRLGYALARSALYRDAVPVLTEFLGRYPQHASTHEAEFWLAESFYHVDALKSALDFYLRYLKVSGGEHREEALYGAGYSEFRQRGFGKAKEYFSKLVSEFPHSKFATDALLREADGLYLAHDFAGAAHAYESAASRAGTGERGEYAQFQAAECYMKLEDRSKAVAILKSFLAEHSHSALVSRAKFLIGWNLFQQKQYPAAISELRELIATAPDSAVASQALYTIGDAQYNAGDYESALATYDKLVNTYPSSPYVDAALTSEQYCLNFLGRDSLAGTVVPHFVEQHADVPAAHELAFKQGDVFYNSQKYGDAVKEFSTVAKRLGNTQDGAAATYWMGKSYLNLGDTAHAIEALNMVAEKFARSPISSTAALDLARIQTTHGSQPETRTAFEQLLKTYDGSQDAANGAIDYAEWLLAPAQHDTARAIETMTQTAQHSPTPEAAARAQILLGKISAARNETDDAAAHFALVAQRSDGLGAEAQFRLGDCYRAAAIYNDAITALLRVKAEYGAFDEWLTRALLALGECYVATNQNDLARESYQTVIAFHHDDDFSTAAQAQLKKLKR